MSKLQKGLFNWFVRIIFSLLILAYIVYKIDFFEFQQVLKNTTLWMYLLGFFLFFLSLISDAVRTTVAARHFKPDIGYFEVIKLQYVSIYYGNMLPFGSLSAEMLKMYFLSKRNVTKNEAMSIVLANKSLGIYFMFAFVIVNLLMFDYQVLPVSNKGILYGLLSVIVILPLCLTMIGFINIFEKGVKKLPEIKLLSITSRVLGLLNSYKLLLTGGMTRVVAVVVLTIVGYSLYLAGCYSLALSLGYDLGFLKMAFLSSLSGIAQIIPIGTMFAGAKDITMLTGLSYEGYSTAKSTAYVLLFNIALLGNNIIGLLFTVFESPIPADILQGEMGSNNKSVV